MFYTVYKVTNKIDGKIYIGCHKTKDLDDGYMGSGKYIKSAQNKHGIENFEKEILEVFDKPEDMFEMEAKLVNSDFVERKDTYNLKEGGNGGFDYLNSNEYDNPTQTVEHMTKLSKLGRNKRTVALKEFYEDEPKVLKRNEKISLTKLEQGLCTFKGKKHSNESKEKMSLAKKGKGVGDQNSQYGTMWIHSLKEKVSKRIKKEELSDWEAKGWLKGRKMKFL